MHKLKSTYYNMKNRCYYINNPNYKSYGGRGILMSKEWKLSFETFCKDMGPKPSHKHSIDRIDNNKGYSKDNCRWATAKEQCNNTRNNVLETRYGVTKTVAQWGEFFETNEGKKILFDDGMKISNKMFHDMNL